MTSCVGDMIGVFDARGRLSACRSATGIARRLARPVPARAYLISVVSPQGNKNAIPAFPTSWSSTSSDSVLSVIGRLRPCPP